ncbi:unnamed protein product [Rhizophagus irregularis]|uniref:Protein kinase domain-containing protein n=1 Tax=Rhizophagus irregularis TaxID=588596 RepID=A0A915YVZ4_9GLOM|nr:unnamed protein product [Rhizophagus irregularis]
MSNNAELTKNSNEYNWIEDAISKKLIKYYEFEQFCDLQEIGFGVKGIVREIQLQREVDFHNNIIRFYGVTASSKENQRKKYMLVMEYADSVSCLHGEGIVHRDLHSNNILVHQNTVKLADFGLSKRIEETSNSQSKTFGLIPYVDPKSFNRTLDILQGLRETPTHDTHEEYIKIYVDCWNIEPDNRPTIDQVVEELKVLIMKENIIIKDFHLYNNTNNSLSSNNHQLSNSTVKISEMMK